MVRAAFGDEIGVAALPCVVVVPAEEGASRRNLGRKTLRQQLVLLLRGGQRVLHDVVVVDVRVGHERLGASIKGEHRGGDFISAHRVGPSKLTQPVLDEPRGVVKERDRGTG